MSNDETRTEAVRVGLKKLLRTGGASPASVLACPELIGLVPQEQNATTTAVIVAQAIGRAIEKLREPAPVRALFGLDPSAEGLTLGDRRAAAAETVNLKPESFRVRREDRLLEELARTLLVELHGDHDSAQPSMTIGVEAERFCPYHGGYIRLMDCPIVATSDLYNATARSSRHSDPPSQSDLGVSTSVPLRSGSDHRRVANLNPRIGERVRSRIDDVERLVLALPPKAPPQQRRRFKTGHRMRLPSPAELAIDAGGTRARPARACPVCLHPLPTTIDHQEPYLISMVGHTGASKTSTALALIEGAGREGPAALGVPAFSPTEATVLHLRTLDPDIFGTFRRREPLRPTDPGHHPPLEFVTTLGDNRPLTVLLHDVAGEDLMDPDRRVQLAPMTLWADTIIFIYNPENSPSYERNTEPPAPDQAVILNGVRDDLEVRGTHDASGRRYADPLLIVAVSKADLVDPGWGLRDGPACESEVKETLRSLGDGAVVTAASRWPEVRWRFIAPHPPSGESQGVLELFGECLQHARR